MVVYDYNYLQNDVKKRNNYKTHKKIAVYFRSANLIKSAKYYKFCFRNKSQKHLSFFVKNEILQFFSKNDTILLRKLVK